MLMHAPYGFRIMTKIFYLKECPYAGSQTPELASSGLFQYSVPKKCAACKNLHEARCKAISNRLLRLDYGFFGVEGSKELTSHSLAKRLIPLKCTSCNYLEQRPLRGLVCKKDEEIWGSVTRGLDY